RPREWTARELADLTDLAATCSAELRLRAVSHAAERAGAAADHFAARTTVTLDSSELLLRAAEVLADTKGLVDVRRQIGVLMSGDLKPVYVGLSLAGPYGLQRLPDPDRSFRVEHDHQEYALREGWPTAQAVRENRMVTVHGEEQLRARFSADAVPVWRELGFESLVCLPLPGSRRVVGALALAWGSHHQPDVAECAVLTAIAGYTATAVERAQFLDERVEVARRMQEAMLTELPEVPGLELAALYRPAAMHDMVGGDWYDAYLLPRADRCDDEDALALTIGDITGHDVHAVTLMGQIRSMLRQADHAHPGEGSAHAVGALERANADLGIGASGTLIHHHLCPVPGGWRMTWTNAGHPPPLLALPDGTTERLTEHGILLHPQLPPARRVQYRRHLPVGATLLLYTDGLVERRAGADMDACTELAGALLAAGVSDGRPLDVLLQDIVDGVAGPSPTDDVALLALRVTAGSDCSDGSDG
ncbi:PP2C family protein-serine/threonine phosphatase, partial [Streptomyces sp. SM12]